MPIGRPPLKHYFEAVVALTVARWRILTQASASHFSVRIDGKSANAEQAELVRRTVMAAARRVPFRALCYEQALAARAMLARRGATSTLHFGGGKEDGRLTAHVWLTSGENIVVGGEEAEKFANLASSPET